MAPPSRPWQRRAGPGHGDSLPALALPAAPATRPRGAHPADAPGRPPPPPRRTRQASRRRQRGARAPHPGQLGDGRAAVPATRVTLDSSRPVRGKVLILCGVAVALAACNVLLLGFPGGLLLALATPLARFLADRLLDGDAVWPAAIMLGLVSPFALLPMYLVAARARTSERARVAIACGLAGILAIALATVVLVAGAD